MSPSTMSSGCLISLSLVQACSARGACCDAVFAQVLKFSSACLATLRAPAFAFFSAACSRSEICLTDIVRTDLMDVCQLERIDDESRI